MSKIKELGFGILDYSHPNILKYTIIEGDSTVDQINEYFDTSSQLLDSSEEPFVLIFDATKGKLVSAEARIVMGKRTKEREEKYINRYNKTFIVIPNMLMNMMLKGVNLITKPKIPQKIFSTIEAAEKAAIEEVENWMK